jgi:uncharacterized protein YndB with AHSA1/START domain
MTEVPDISRSIIVPASPAEAFRVYTEHPAQWLPPEHTFIRDAMAIVMEPRAGGRYYERGADGAEITRGTILEWDPPARLVMTWRVGPNWRPVFDDEHASRVAVDFTPLSPDSTEVVVTYTELDRHGDMAPMIRAAIDLPGPGPTLQRYAEAVARLAGVPPEIDTSVPHSARIWNYWLGGKTHFAADREAGDRYREVYPAIVDTARAGRAFLARAVRFLTSMEGVRQFIDVGAGLPTGQNTHQIAQGVAPESRVVYVDNDPMVLVHSQALLDGSPQGSCDYIDADMRDTAAVLSRAARTLDLTQPAAVILVGVLGHIAEYDAARAVVSGLTDALAPGSYLVLADSIRTTEAHSKAGAEYASTGAVPYALRSPAEIRAFFEDLTIIPPGLVRIHEWRPTPSPTPPVPVDTLGAIGRKAG